VTSTTATGGRSTNAAIFDYTPFANGRKGLRGWWLTPPRSGLRRVIAPWVYRHLRFFGAAHTAGGSVASAAGIICLSYRAYGWATLFAVIGALNLAGGLWYLTISRGASARTESAQPTETDAVRVRGDRRRPRGNTAT
jgi:hypothetical protein